MTLSYFSLGRLSVWKHSNAIALSPLIVVSFTKGNSANSDIRKVFRSSCRTKSLTLTN